MIHTIKRWDNGEVIAEREGRSLADVILELVKECVSLDYAEINGAVFNHAVIDGGKFAYAKFNDSAFNHSAFNHSAFNHSAFNHSEFNHSAFNDVNGLPVGIVVPNLHQKILAAISSDGGVLDMSTWHKCDTTHCRAGWDIQLAGAAGAELERQVGPWMAGRLITLASCPWMTETPNFFATNAAALADIQACAAREIEESAKTNA